VYLLIGVIIPPAALLTAYVGSRMRVRGQPLYGAIFIVLGLTVFVVRLALYIHTGFRSAF
jgi:hypothetical protein